MSILRIDGGEALGYCWVTREHQDLIRARELGKSFGGLPDETEEEGEVELFPGAAAHVFGRAARCSSHFIGWSIR